MTIEELGAEYLVTCKKMSERAKELKKLLSNIPPEKKRKLYKRIAELVSAAAYCRKVSKQLCEYYRSGKNSNKD